MTNAQDKQNKAPTIRRRVLHSVLGLLTALVVVALLAAGVYYILRWQGRASLLDREQNITAPESLVDNAEDEGQRITYKGETYRFNDAVVSMLFMGVDKTDIQQDTSYGQNGQADSLFLATLDTKTGQVKIIPLSRESMVDVNLYDADGAYIGAQQQQLCLAYAYGATGKESCENVLRSVGRLLYGMPIDGYAAIDLEGVAALNAAVGGVQVTALEDISVYAKGRTYILSKGQKVTLNNETVLPYIRQRGDDLDANNRRMQRQRQFLGEFIRVAASKVKQNFTSLEKYYNAAKTYVVSDLSVSEITYLVSTYLVGGQSEIQYLDVTGTTTLGETYAEFYPDETSLYEAVLAAFYTKEN